MISFEFSGEIWAYCNGNWYNTSGIGGIDVIEEPAGTPVMFYANIKCLGLVGGGPCGRARFDVIWDDIVRCHTDYEWYCDDTPHENLTCEVTIPSTEKSVRFCATSDEPICYDSKCCITLKPKAVPSCDQLVKVTNPALEPIESAAVIVPISATESALCYTDANGFCYITGLTVDSIYTACASKANYEHYGDDGCKLFTACSPYAVLLTLHKPCEQGFGVRDQDNNPIESATVTVTGGVTCTTDGNGCCSISLDADLSYSAEATKDGYVCFGSECRQENFKCVPYSSLPLKLQKAEIGKIESYFKPNELEEGEELTVSFIAKNIGLAHGLLGGFKMHLWIDGTKYDTEPDIVWKSLDHNETWEDEVNTIGSIPLWSMPNHNVNVKIVLEDKYEGDIATEEFVVAIKGHPEIGKIESIYCTAEEDLITGGWEIKAAVVVKNTDTVEHAYRIKMYDEYGEHLGDEPDGFAPETAAGDTITINLDTEWAWFSDAPTSKVRFDLYKARLVYPDIFVESQTKDCKEEPAIHIPWTAIMYGGIAIAIGTLGSILPGKIGKVVPVLAIVPGGLCVYSLYKEYADKIPFLSTELEQLALPPKLTETLRKKKVLL